MKKQAESFYRSKGDECNNTRAEIVPGLIDAMYEALERMVVLAEKVPKGKRTPEMGRTLRAMKKQLLERNVIEVGSGLSF